MDQLEELYFYIAERRSPAVAERYTSAVVETCEGLALFPLRGVPREDIRREPPPEDVFDDQCLLVAEK